MTNFPLSNAYSNTVEPNRELFRIRAERLRRSFYSFVKAAWHLIEPVTPFIESWVVEGLCLHCQAVFDGRIDDLIANVPPGTAKSSIVAVLLPCWIWATAPHERFIVMSHKEKLAIRDNVRRRNVISSEWYQSRWPIQLTGDMNQKGEFHNSATGFMVALGAGGSTGYRGSYLILDDPNNATEMESDNQRETKLQWIDEQWSSRGNTGYHEILIQQRTNEQDVTGHYLAQGGYVLYKVPMEYAGEKNMTSIGWSDPRTVIGELMNPALYPAKRVAKLKLKLGDFGYAGQCQQEPYQRGGGMFDVERLRANIIPRRYHEVMRGRGWDLAATEKKTSKRTAGVLMSRDPMGRYYIEHVVCDKMRPDKRNAKMKATTQADGQPVFVLFEHEGGSSGEDQALSIVRMLAGYVVEGIKVTGDKVARADAVAAQCNGGNVYIVDDGTWDVETFLNELEAFPNGTYKDQVDALSLIFNKLAAMPDPSFWQDAVNADRNKRDDRAHGGHSDGDDGRSQDDNQARPPAIVDGLLPQGGSFRIT